MHSCAEGLALQCLSFNFATQFIGRRRHWEHKSLQGQGTKSKLAADTLIPSKFVCGTNRNIGLRPDPRAMLGSGFARLTIGFAVS